MFPLMRPNASAVAAAQAKHKARLAEKERKEKLALPVLKAAYWVGGVAYTHPRDAAGAWIRLNCGGDVYQSLGGPISHQIRADKVLENQRELVNIFKWLAQEELVQETPK